MNNDNIENPLSVSLVLQKAFEQYKQGLSIYIPISLLYAVLSVLTLSLLHTFQVYSIQLYFTLNIFLSSWFSIALIYASSMHFRKKKISVSQALQSPGECYLVYMAVTLSMFFLMSMGFLMFVLPGLYVTTIFIFADLLIVIERTTFLDAFKKSMELVKGNFGRVLLYIFFIVLISICPEIVSQIFKDSSPVLGTSLNRIISVFIMPFYVIAQVVLYYFMKSIKKETEKDPIFI